MTDKEKVRRLLTGKCGKKVEDMMLAEGICQGKDIKIITKEGTKGLHMIVSEEIFNLLKEGKLKIRTYD